jgi:ribosome-associated toxin RatA of RatAB toxin-antitoxin module
MRLDGEPHAVMSVAVDGGAISALTRFEEPRLLARFDELGAGRELWDRTLDHGGPAMKQVQTSVTTHRSPDEVYDYLVDFSNQPEWRFDVVDSRLVQGEPGRVGARYRQSVKQGRRDMTTEVELTRAERPIAVSFRTVGDDPVSASGTWQIREADGVTQVVTDVSIEAHGFLKAMEPFMGPSLRKTAARYEQALSERLSDRGG